MPKITREETSNPAFEGDVRGSKDAHSSMDAPTDHMDAADASHAQSDDDIQDTGPNLTGDGREEATRGFEMEQTLSWRSGEMTAWRDNDDYMKFFMRTDGPDSGLMRSGAIPTMADLDHDNDFDDNGGIPLAHGHYFGDIGAIDLQAFGTGINALIIRRL